MAHMGRLMVVALLVAGCATSSSVKGQLDPLAERIARLEKQQAELQGRLSEATSAQAATDAKLTKASGDAQGLRADVQALRADLDATTAVAKNAEQAAAEAHAATIRAETAATKAAKAFELQQKKR